VRFAALLPALFVLASGCQRDSRSQPCRVESELALARCPAAPRDVALVATDDGFVAAWVTRDGIFAASLDERGQPRGVPIPVLQDSARPRLDALLPKAVWQKPFGPAIAGEDLALARTSTGAAVAVLVPGQPGAVYAAHLTTGEAGPLTLLGEAGPNATSIDIVSPADGQLLVAWHRGDDRASTIELVVARLENGVYAVRARQELGRPGSAFSVSLAAQDGKALLAWAELDRGVPPTVVAYAATLDERLSLGQTHAVGRGRYLHPTLDVVARQEPGFALVFRDDVDDDETPEYYHVALDPHGAPTSAPTRISKSDGYTGPRLSQDGGLVAAATIRSFQRNLLIGLNRFDEQGRKAGGELQVYADKTDFVRVDVARGKTGLLLLYGEDRAEEGRVLVSRVACVP
jgi:hypothetical protein